MEAVQGSAGGALTSSAAAAGLPKPHANKPKPRKGRFRRFARGYLQITGALVNLYVLVILLVQLLIFLGKHFSLG